MITWPQDANFYHIYPLGLCGAPADNDFSAPAEPRLKRLHQWVGHLRSLGITALYLGPLFESSSHGYDIADYDTVDRRLGCNADVTNLIADLHAAGIRVILDGVFHHVGRDFWAFRDVQEQREQSPYRDWFAGIDFARQSRYGDPFAYEGWKGHYNLVKLNLGNPAVREHLFGAVQRWVEQFAIDGLRLDVAEDIELAFLHDLAAHCHSLRSDFWLLGEVIHGDYRRWVNPSTLDAVTNYECYKGLFSGHNDRNYFELAYSLNRQFGPGGIYENLPLYNFADNHDVHRVASMLRNPDHLSPLYALLFTMPGVPSIYYGSEWGVAGVKQAGDDRPLRPQLPTPADMQDAPHPDLAAIIARFAHIRRESRALRRGAYRQVFVAHEQFAFARFIDDEYVVVAVNAAETPAELKLPVAVADGRGFVDLLEPQAQFGVDNGHVRIDAVPPCWARILAVR